MIHQKIKNLFMSSVEHVCSNISNYSIHPDIDFQRNRKISSQKLISFLVSQGSHPQKSKCWTFGAWMLLPYLLLQPLTSSVIS